MSLTPQQLQFELMRLASFNNFDGDQVVDDLQANPALWEDAMMGRIKLDPPARSGEWALAC